MAIEIISTPARKLSINNSSRWGAAFNPQLFLLQRKDFVVTEVIDYYEDGTSAQFVVNGTLTEDEIIAIQSNKVRVKTNLYDFYREIEDIENTGGVIKFRFGVPFIAGVLTPGGFINSTGLKPGYKVQSQINIAGETITTRHTPDLSGAVRVDLQAYLKAFTNSNDEDANYNLFSWLDHNRFEQYLVEFSEFYSNATHGEIIVPDDFFITHSALQFNPYGSSMAEYTTFQTEPNINKAAKFLTHVKQPVFTPGYPFDLSVILNDELDGKTILCRYATLDINKVSIQGLQSSALLLNPYDAMKINEADNLLINSPVYSFSIGGSAGVWRLPIIDSLTPFVHFIELYLYYLTESGDVVRISEIKTIKINRDNCRNDDIYVKWINLLGGWDYQLFDYRSEHSVDVSQTFIDRLVFDYATQNATQDVLSKTGLEKIKVGKSGVTAEVMNALKGLLLSPKVYRLTSFNPRLWQTVVLDTKGTTLYDTQDWFGDFETTLKLPTLNIQTA